MLKKYSKYYYSNLDAAVSLYVGCIRFYFPSFKTWRLNQRKKNIYRIFHYFGETAAFIEGEMKNIVLITYRVATSSFNLCFVWLCFVFGERGGLWQPPWCTLFHLTCLGMRCLQMKLLHLRVNSTMAVHTSLFRQFTVTQLTFVIPCRITNGRLPEESEVFLSFISLKGSGGP